MSLRRLPTIASASFVHICCGVLRAPGVDAGFLQVPLFTVKQGT